MRTTYATEDVEQLKENPCVFSCTGRFINYTYEFKKRALELHGEGITAKEIWLRSGFDVGKWKKSYFRDTLKDWKKIVRKNGLEGLQKHGGIQFDRGPNKTEADKIKRLSLQVKYLEAENDFLAKLRAKRAE
jgi:hypothetical protein